MFENMFIADVLFVITLRLQTVASHEPGMEGGSGVQRRVRDQAARQRRGSIKSRIVQFSKVSIVQYSTLDTVQFLFWWVVTILGRDRAIRARELSELKFKLPLTAVSGVI